MWKPLTGEPYAGKPHVRFGGRGGTEPSLPLSSAPSRATLLVLFEVGLADGLGGYGFADEAGEEDDGEDVG